MSESGDWVVIAAIVRAHGLRGMVTTSATGPTAATLEAGEALLVTGPGWRRALELAERAGTAARPLMRFTGIEDRDAAQALAGGEVRVPAARLPPPADPDTFYVRDLLGYAVGCGERELGSVAGVTNGPANDVLEIVTAEGPLLIPFTADAIVMIDTDRRRMTVRADLLWGG